MLFALSVCALVLSPAGASAATIDVDATPDETTLNAACSLREAVHAAVNNTNTHEPACQVGDTATDTIAVPPGTYTFLPNPGGVSENLNMAGDLDFTTGANGTIVIDGAAGAGAVPLTILDGGNVDRILDLQSDGTNVVNVNFRELILRNGNAPGASDDGGAVRILDQNAHVDIDTSRVLDSDAGRWGGAISFDNALAGAELNVDNTEFSGNTAGHHGGAIYFDLFAADEGLVDNSAFTGNSSLGSGGAVYIESSGTMAFANNTLSGNSAATGGGAIGFGGGSGTVTMDFTTIAGNTTPVAGGGGAFSPDSAGDSISLLGSILSGNLAAGVDASCRALGSYVTDGYNIESANNCGLNTGAPDFDLINTNPLLGPLAFYPGPGAVFTTPTHGLYDASAALNRVPHTPTDFCASAGLGDQRFVSRPAGPEFCDVGAFEGSIGPAPDTDGDGVVDPADSCPTQAGPASNGGCPVPASPGPGTTTPTPLATPQTTCPPKKKKKKKKRSAVASKKKKKKKKTC